MATNMASEYDPRETISPVPVCGLQRLSSTRSSSPPRSAPATGPLPPSVSLRTTTSNRTSAGSDGYTERADLSGRGPSGWPTDGPSTDNYKWLVQVEAADPSADLGPAYRLVWSRHGFPTAPQGSTTCFDIWRNSVQSYGNERCLGWRPANPEGKPMPYTFLSYNEVEQQVAALSAALAARGLQAGDRVAVYGANSPEWIIVLQACNRMSYVCVPVYDTLGPDAVRYIINHAAVRVLFASSDKLQHVLRVLPALEASIRQQLLLLVHWGPRPMGHMESSSPSLDSLSRASSAGPSAPTTSTATSAAAGAAGAVAGGNGGIAGGGCGGCGGCSGGASEGEKPAGGIGDAGPSGVQPSSNAEGGGGGGGPLRCSFTELLAQGSEAGGGAPVPPRPYDITTIMYTSGTTGDPKGVLLSHGSVVAAVASMCTTLSRYTNHIGPGDSMLSYLPLAHIFDRVSEETCLAMGASIGYWFGDVAGVAEDAAALRPTVFIGVPRVYERIYTTAQYRLSKVSWLRRTAFAAMYDRKLAALRAGARPEAPALRLCLWPAGWGRQAASSAAGGAGDSGVGLGFLDWIVFRRIRNALGGRLRLVVSGGAPLAGRVEEFLKVTLGCPVTQGYGLTETCAASFLQDSFSWEQFGSVGPPLPSTEFRLRSLPEMGYLASGGGEACELPAGEVLIRGPQLFSGYYRRPDLTSEALLNPPADPQGGREAAAEAGDGGLGLNDLSGSWFCTGDIGALRPDGSVAIIDRAKNMFKMSQGEYISPEHLEQVYGTAPVVEQVWIHGDSTRRSLVAVVVPDLHKLLRMAGNVTIAPASSSLPPAAAPAGPAELAAELGTATDGNGNGSGAGRPTSLRTAVSEPSGPVTAGTAVEGGDGGAADAAKVMGSLCRSPKAREVVLRQMQDVGLAAKVRGFELVRAVMLAPEHFTPENELLTPTLKLRRPALIRRYRREIDEMYEQLGE